MSLIAQYDLNNKRRLPYGYTELAFILSDDENEIIDTGVLPSTTLKAYMKFAPLEYTGGANLGSDSLDILDWRFACYSGGFFFDVGNSRVGYGTNNVILNLDETYEIYLSNNSVTIAGIGTYSGTVQTERMIATKHPIAVFGMRGSASVDSGVKMRLYALQMEDNGKLIRDYIPCRNSSGEAGLYDLVHHKFYGNDLSGTFTEGPEVISLPSEYLQVEYLESTKLGEYIDTNLNLDWTKDINIDLKLNNSNIVGGWYSIFGYRVSTSESLCVFLYGTDLIALDYYGGGTFTSLKSGIHDINITKTALTIDGTSKTATWTYPSNLSTGTKTLWLFQGNGNPGIRYSSIKIYSCKISNGGTVVRNFVPCYRCYDNVAGMYDTINNVFYTNKGNGCFIQGSAVNRSSQLTEYNQLGKNLWTGNYAYAYNARKIDNNSFYITTSTTNSGNQLARVLGLGFNNNPGPWSISFDIIATADITVNTDICDTNNGASGQKTINVTTTKQRCFITSKPWGYYWSHLYNGFWDIEYTAPTSSAITITVSNIVLLLGTITEPTPYIVASPSINYDISLPEQTEIIDFIDDYEFYSKYQQVEYILSDGNQYIDTGSRMSASGDRFTCIWADVYDDDGNKVVGSSENKGYGQGASGNNPNIAGGGRIHSGIVSIWLNGSNYDSTLSSTDTKGKVFVDHILVASDGWWITMCSGINTYISSYLTTSTLSFADNNMWLFRDSGTDYPYPGAKRIYDVKFFSNYFNNLQKHLVPCYRRSDNVIGMYDMVGKLFYTNGGTGTFTVGKDISKLPLSYQEVEYILGNGTAYIDTGVILTSTTALQFKVLYDAILSTTNLTGWRIYGYDIPDYSLGIDTYGCFSVEGSGNRVSSGATTDSTNYLNKRVLYMADYLNKTATMTYQGNAVQTLTLNTPTTLTFYGKGYRLFGTVNGSGNAANVTCTSKLYGCKMWINNELIRNFIPCIRKRDKLPGLFDNVNNQFYLCPTSSFIAGKDESNDGTYFNGSTSLINIPAFSGGISYSFDIYIEEDVTSSTQLVIFTDYNSTVGFGFYNGYCITGTSNGKNKTIAAFTKGWHHVIVIKDTTNKLFVDGIEQADVDGGDNWSNSNTSYLQIGMRNNGSASQFPFKGRIKNFKVYDHIISDSEIKILSLY